MGMMMTIVSKELMASWIYTILYCIRHIHDELPLVRPSYFAATNKKCNKQTSRIYREHGPTILYITFCRNKNLYKTFKLLTTSQKKCEKDQSLTKYIYIYIYT